ncbi:U3 small nucleolar RNA-associated protein 18-like protein [Iris pallida]|uniref:U3 small nucleolar RNA-associated protein 18 homolog n=1 Tax=Iris pallida TaxID=29817 RepID=A0AAX6GQS1_IRIPA|nr:U3 small nucleolar RNA-associated protein 18-like protein [Iris pallida]
MTTPLAGATDEFEVEPEPEPKRSKKKSRKRSRRDTERKEQEKEMKSLENALFGTLYSPPEFGNEEAAAAAADGTEEEEKPALPMFFTDKSGSYEVAVYEEDTERKKPDGEERKPAWIDEDDAAIEVDIEKVPRLRKLREFKDEKVISGAKFAERLRAQHRKLNPGTDWARLDRKVAASDDESDDGSDVTGDDVLRSNYELVEKSGVKLLPGVLEYSRLVDANAEEQSNGPINSVEFHRNGQLLLAAGLDKKLIFFQVDGKRNTKVQSIFLEDCPIRKASFLPDGSQVIVSGRRKFFYSFDLVKAAVDKIGPLTGREEKSIEVFEVSPDSKTIAFIGNDGYILLVSPRTKELIGTLKMNGTARSLAFVDGGQQLMSSGGDGQVYHWDLRTRRCIHRAVDEGCITGSALCASPNSNLFAAGSSSGIVNIYKRDDFLGGKRKPLKAVENLTTKVDFMKFNHDAQILAICSTMKKNSLKLVHVPSFSVFSNWPAPKFSLQYPRCLDFSPGGGFMAFGNAAGKVLLYKLHHYQKA